MKKSETAWKINLLRNFKGFKIQMKLYKALCQSMTETICSLIIQYIKFSVANYQLSMPRSGEQRTLLHNFSCKDISRYTSDSSYESSHEYLELNI